MVENLKTIDRSGIKALVKERLEHPEKYVDTPLLIWRANIRDDNQEAILADVFNEYNVGKTERDSRWYKIASVQQMPYTKSDILSNMLCGLFVEKYSNKAYQGPVTAYSGSDSHQDVYERGLIVIDPILASLDYSRKPELLSKYRSVINNRKWDSFELTSGVPVIAYMCVREPWFETPEAYPHAEQYLFEPDFEEWAEWAEEKAGFPKELIDFIRGDGNKDGIRDRRDCKWQEMVDILIQYTKRAKIEELAQRSDGIADDEESLQKEMSDIMRSNKLEKLSDLNDDLIKNVAYAVHIPADVTEDLCKYLIKYKE